MILKEYEIMIAEYKDKILKMKEAEGLPDSFIENIVKIANEQEKFSDLKWVRKMLVNAKVKYEQQLKVKSKKQVEIKPESITSLKYVEKQQYLNEKNFQLNEILKELPYIENYPKLFPRVSFAALVFIQKKYGFWTLRMLSVLEDKSKIYTNFAIKFTSVLYSEIGLQESIKAELHKNPDLLYKTIVSNGKYIDSKSEIEKFLNWKKNEYFERKKEVEQ
jgi:hypothetical protein